MTTPASGRPRRSLTRAVGAAVLVALYSVALVRTAWLQDDAFITFRTVDNVCAGLGPTWNPAERVQINVHPLWTAILVPVYALTRDIYASSLALSMVLSIAAFALVVGRLASSLRGAFLGGLVLLFSTAFVEYSTGGLENPLTHLLLAVFALLYLRERADARALFRLSLVTGLLLLTRADLLALVAPALALRVAAQPLRSVRTWLALLAGLAPVALWLAFATLYYGTPVPNPAMAKLFGLDLPRSRLLHQGLAYFRESLARDPVTLGTIAVVSLLTCRRGARALAPFAIGTVLYLAYVLWIGGCFMSGRFFAAPLLLSAIALVRAEPLLPSGTVASLLVALALAGLAARQPAILTGADYHVPGIPADGVVDCRGFYFQDTGLIARDPDRWDPGARVSGAPPVVMADAIGYVGFGVGPGVHVVDRLGLCDPLLARLPVANRETWRVGHTAHHLPAGYLKSVRTGENRIEDPDLRAYYERLRILTRGPLFTRERMETIAGFLTGRYDALLARYSAGPYRAEVRNERSIDELAVPVARGTPWYDPRTILLAAPLSVRLGGVRRAPRVEIALDGNDRYLVVFRRGGVPRAHLDVPPIAEAGEPGLQVHALAVPEPAIASGYDEIVVVPGSGDTIYALGHLRLEEDGGT